MTPRSSGPGKVVAFLAIFSSELLEVLQIRTTNPLDVGSPVASAPLAALIWN